MQGKGASAENGIPAFTQREANFRGAAEGAGEKRDKAHAEKKQETRCGWAAGSRPAGLRLMPC